MPEAFADFRATGDGTWLADWAFMLTKRSSRPSSFFFTLPVVACAIAAVGCSSSLDDGPAEPSDAVATVTPSASSAPDTFTALVSCKGDADDIAKLGSLCAGTPVPTSMSTAQAGSRLVTMAASTGPALLVYAFPPAGVSPDALTWTPSEVRYAAFLVLSPPESADADSAWSSGEALTGTLGASAIGTEACSAAWRGGGELHWRSVTITLDWSTGVPC